VKKINILILFLIIYCGGGEIAEEPTTAGFLTPEDV